MPYVQKLRSGRWVRRFRQHFAAVTVMAFLVLLLGACTLSSGGHDRATQFPNDRYIDTPNTARLSFFLHLERAEGTSLRINLSRVEVLAGDVWLPVTQTPQTIDSAELAEGQLFLGRLALDPGLYRQLRLQVSRVEVRNAAGVYQLVSEQPRSLVLPIAGQPGLEAGDSRSVLLSWDTNDSLLPDNQVSLDISAAAAMKQLPVDLILVSCPEINTIYVIRADRNWVVDSFGIRGYPTDLAVAPGSADGLLYVLCPGERLVKVVDLTNDRVIDYLTAPLNDEPVHMAISPDGRQAFLLDEKYGYLSRLDLLTGQRQSRVQLGFRPNYVTYLAEQGLLAVSLSMSQQLVLLDPETLTTQEKFATGAAPEGLVADRGLLYVAESGDHRVGVYELSERNGVSRIPVGFGPRRLLATENQIYVSNYRDGSVSMLQPGQGGVSQDIFGFGQPLAMAFDPFYRRLYVADEASESLKVVNVNSNRIIADIQLGAIPYAMAVIR